MILTDARTRVREARLQDSSRAAICGCVVFAAVAGLFGAGLLLGSAKGLAGGEASRYIALAALTVVSSWLLVHTVLALHYAHVCYHIAEESREKPPNVGVVFPNEPQPDFLDFALLLFRHRDDVPGLGCANHLAAHSADRAVARSALLRIQHSDPRAKPQSRFSAAESGRSLTRIAQFPGRDRRWLTPDECVGN